MLETVESVSINADDSIFRDEGFVMAWLPRVSGSLKSLSMSSSVSLMCIDTKPKLNALLLISAYCHNLVNLKLEYGHFSMQNLHPMPKLTSLALKLIDVDVDDKHLNDQLNQCFPNLQVLKLTVSREFKDLNLHLPDLQAFYCLMFSDSLDSLTLITPSLVTLIITCIMPPAIHVEAPVLSYFDLTIYNFKPAETFTIKKFENLKTLSLDTSCIGSLLSEFPITKTVETLALCTRTNTARADSKLTLAKVFTVFPNVSSLSLISGGWSKLEACSKPESWEIFDGRKGLKTIYAYLMLADPLLTFMCIARVLDQCVNLLEVSFGLSYNVSYDTSQTFKSKCMARWPGLKWRWERRSWIPGCISN